jgi:exodeoxyribonuclease V alpha subunit
VSTSPGESINRASQPPAEHLQGIVERVTYHAEDSGYTVARLKAPGERDLITIVGSFPDIHAGQTLRLTGFWREHLKYGRQFQCLHAQETKPATLTGVEKYLGSGLIKGIGPVTARRIVAHFGLETLDIIEHSCSRLIEVTGIGEKRVAMIEKAWAAQQAIKEVMLFLRGHNVSSTYAVKISKQYGDQAIEMVSKRCSYCSKALASNPLILSDEAKLAVYHAECAAALATEILIDLYTFFSPPAPYERLFVLTAPDAVPP